MRSREGTQIIIDLFKGAEGSIFAAKPNDEFLREMIDRARRLDEEIKQAREEEQTNG